jgi:hypothetical protein
MGSMPKSNGTVRRVIFVVAPLFVIESVYHGQT